MLTGTPPTIYGDGTQTRDYVHVSDVVRGFLAAAAAPPGTWNIGTGTEASVLDLADLIARAADRAVRPEFSPPRAGELQRSVLAVGRAARDLGWRAETRLADGIGDVYRWMRPAPVRAALPVAG